MVSSRSSTKIRYSFSIIFGSLFFGYVARRRKIIANPQEISKARDLYDIFFLLRYAEDSKKIAPHLRDFLENFERPLDENDLKVLILVGVSPRTDDMLDYLGRWLG